MPIADPGPLPWVSGQTIGSVLEQTVVGPSRPRCPGLPGARPALVLGRAGPACRADRPGADRAGSRAGRARGNLVDERAGVGRDPVRGRPASAQSWSTSTRPIGSTSSRTPYAWPTWRRSSWASAFKSSDFVGMVHSVCPEVAAASDREWTSARLPRLKRLIALGDRPGPGWFTWNDLEAGPAARWRIWTAGTGNWLRATSSTSSSLPARQGCPRGRCSPTPIC